MTELSQAEVQHTHTAISFSGNLLEYRKGLIKRYGDRFVEDLESQSIRRVTVHKTD
jgi:hypothetical protein